MEINHIIMATKAILEQIQANNIVREKGGWELWYQSELYDRLKRYGYNVTKEYSFVDKRIHSQRIDIACLNDWSTTNTAIEIKVKSLLHESDSIERNCYLEGIYADVIYCIQNMNNDMKKMLEYNSKIINEAICVGIIPFDWYGDVTPVMNILTQVRDKYFFIQDMRLVYGNNFMYCLIINKSNRNV